MGKHGKTQKRQLESLVIGPENWRNSEKDRLCEALKWPLVFFPIVAIWLKGSICGEAFLGTCPETWISQKLMKIQSHELGMLWDWVKLCDRFIVIVYLDCSF
jgi:hypothetical protein